MGHSRRFVAEVEDVGFPRAIRPFADNRKIMDSFPVGQSEYTWGRHLYHSDFPDQLLRFPNTSRWPTTGTRQELDNLFGAGQPKHHDR